jgi:hypothetical protein
LCLGAIFDITAGTTINQQDSSTPEWIVGDTFLVRFLLVSALKAP